MLYVNAVETTGNYIAPQHVYGMTEEQSHRVQDAERSEFYKKPKATGLRWYADNTREPIRDETLRDGLVHIGAAVKRTDIPTTSSKGRYALQREFASLFNPDLQNEQLEKAITDWQENNLSKSALTRVKINLRGATTADKILVTFPNGETRHLAAGPSSIISKHVIEEFAKKFLAEPFLLWLSESGNKAPHRDDVLAKELGLDINVSLDLPDIVLVDTGAKDPLIVFVEVVATDGAITPRRISAIYEMTDKAGFKRSQIAFVSAYMDRQSTGFKKTIRELGWNSFVWFASEPDNLFILHEGTITLSTVISKLRDNLV